ncbi:MAG: hypothetical protein ACXADW_21025 [Candidatus Hodarchaeales archaeon]|jgi:hypothetical protein
MIKLDKTKPFPYLPNYTGTYEDRRAAFQLRLRQLASDLETLKFKFEENENDTSLLEDLEKCHKLVREMMD